tara:strand:+ start:262 stop:471 length:210 start_codon:yes stop_codon:yes gene_type:complete
MTREEYELVYSAFQSYRYLMTDKQEVLSEKILDDLFYAEFDKLPTDPDLSVSPCEGVEDTIKELNFRSK